MNSLSFCQKTPVSHLYCWGVFYSISNSRLALIFISVPSGFCHFFRDRSVFPSCIFSPLLLKFSIFAFYKFYSGMPSFGFLWVHLAWSMLSFLNLWVGAFHLLRKFSHCLLSCHVLFLPCSIFPFFCNCVLDISLFPSSSFCAWVCIFFFINLSSDLWIVFFCYVLPLAKHNYLVLNFKYYIFQF